MEELNQEKISLSDIPISAEDLEKSIAVFAEFIDCSDDKLTQKNKSVIDDAFENISSPAVYKAVSDEMLANQPNIIEQGTIGEYIYEKISQSRSQKVDEEMTVKTHVYTKSEKGMTKISDGNSDFASVYCTDEKYSMLSKEEYDRLYQEGIRKVDILNSENGESYAKISLSENDYSGSSNSEEVDVGSRSPNMSNTSSPNSKMQGYTIEHTIENENKSIAQDRKPVRKPKKPTSYGWIALLIIIIVIVIVLVAIVWACRRSTKSVECSKSAALEYNTPVVATTTTSYVEKEEYAISTNENSCTW